MKFYFALRREGEALASSSPSPSTFRRAQRPRPPSLHRRPTSSILGMSKKRPVGVRLEPQARKTTTRHVSSVSSRTEHRHPPRAHQHDRREEISGVARRSEPKERGSKPCVSNPRCGLRGRLTCGWHSATGEQSASSRQTAAEQRAARRSATSCSPRQPFRRLIRADRERPATLRRPWWPECHLRRTCGAETGRQRGHQPRPGAARSEERRSGALLRRSATARGG